MKHTSYLFLFIEINACRTAAISSLNAKIQKAKDRLFFLPKRKNKKTCFLNRNPFHLKRLLYF